MFQEIENSNFLQRKKVCKYKVFCILPNGRITFDVLRTRDKRTFMVTFNQIPNYKLISDNMRKKNFTLGVTDVKSKKKIIKLDGVELVKAEQWELDRLEFFNSGDTPNAKMYKKLVDIVKKLK